MTEEEQQALQPPDNTLMIAAGVIVQVEWDGGKHYGSETLTLIWPYHDGGTVFGKKQGSDHTYVGMVIPARCVSRIWTQVTEPPPQMEAGRFALISGENDYVTSWDTWEEAAVAFDPVMPADHRLVDAETGRVWHPGTRYEWEDAQT